MTQSRFVFDLVTYGKRVVVNKWDVFCRRFTPQQLSTVKALLSVAEQPNLKLWFLFAPKMLVFNFN